jgi:HEXXH motif-containing protein
MPPIDPPRDLTLPEPGSTTARSVLSRALARLLPELSAAGRGAAQSAEARADLATFGALLRDLSARDKGALPSLVRRVNISALLRCLRGGGSEALFAEAFGSMLFELSLAGALRAPVRQRRPARRLLSIGAGVALTLPEDTRELVFESGRLVWEGSSGRTEVDLEAAASLAPGASLRAGAVLVEAPYYPIAGGMVLALADNNPLSMFEAHPDKEGNAIDLGGRPAEEWTGVLREALDLVEAHLPELRREMDLYVQQIVPVGYHEERHLSASYQEAIGTIYMTLHPSLMTMTEALIHEFSHNKINALFELDPVLENAFSPLYTSPVRPDPRPLHGVLLAVHAFLPVARLYERMIEAGHPLAQNDAFTSRFARIRQINAEGAEVVLVNGVPTEVGRALLDEIRRWHHYFGRWAASD